MAGRAEGKAAVLAAAREQPTQMCRRRQCHRRMPLVGAPLAAVPAVCLGGPFAVRALRRAPLLRIRCNAASGERLDSCHDATPRQKLFIP